MNETLTIKEPVLKEFIQAGGEVRAKIFGRHRGFALVFRLGNYDRALVTARGADRLFASLDTAGAFIRELGLPCFEVDMASHQPGRLRRARPDRAEALRNTRTRMHQQPLEFENVETHV